MAWKLNLPVNELGQAVLARAHAVLPGFERAARAALNFKPLYMGSMDARYVPCCEDDGTLQHSPRFLCALTCEVMTNPLKLRWWMSMGLTLRELHPVSAQNACVYAR